MERSNPEGASARRAEMVEELRTVELVRDRLASLRELVDSYPEGHKTRALLEDLHLERALQTVEEDIEALREVLLHPRGT